MYFTGEQLSFILWIRPRSSLHNSFSMLRKLERVTIYNENKIKPYLSNQDFLLGTSSAPAPIVRFLDSESTTILMLLLVAGFSVFTVIFTAAM